MRNSTRVTLVAAATALLIPVLASGSAYAASAKGDPPAAAQHSGQRPVEGSPAAGPSGSGPTSSARTAGGGATRSPADPSGSSVNPDGTFQGKGESAPDQDGKGLDRGLDNNDKTGPGTDGNNGCGNEPRDAAPQDGGRPTEDDNNGLCGSRPAQASGQPSGVAPAGGVQTPTAAQSETTPPAAAEDGFMTEPAGATTTVGTQGLSSFAADAGSAFAAAAGSSTALGAPAGLGNAVGTGAVAGDVTGAGSGSARAAVTPSALPFTGSATWTLLALGVLTLVLGSALMRLGRRQRLTP